MVFAALGIVSLTGSGQTAAQAAGTGSTLVTEQFKDASVSDTRWLPFGSACLTGAAKGAAAPAGSSTLAGCTSTVDTDSLIGQNGDGYLQLTDNTAAQTSDVLYNRAVPSAAGLDVSFYQYQVASSGNVGIGAADGIGFFLTDGAYTLTNSGPTGSGSGGALGYASINDGGDQPGIAHGALGIGLDSYGNFSSQPFAGRNCSPSSFRTPNSVAIRGAGNGTSGYCLLDNYSAPGFTLQTNAPTGQVGGVQGSSTDPASYLVHIVISPTTTANPLPTVTVSYGGVQVMQYQLKQALPSTVKFGFAASTGGGHQAHLVRQLSVKTVDNLGAISLVKAVNHDTTIGGTDKTIFTAGDTVPYSFLVTNTGDEALHDVSVTDPKISNITCPKTTLASADSMTCTGVYGPLTSTEATAGSFTNNATVNGTTTDGDNATASSTVTIPTYTTGAFSVTKQVTGTGQGTVGSTAAFTVGYSYSSGNYMAGTATATGTYPAGSGTLTVHNDGQAVTSGAIPTGAAVTLNETAPSSAPSSGSASATWGTPSFSQNTITIGDATTAAVQLTNPVALDTGKFSITKVVTGDGASLVPADTAFTGTYNYAAVAGVYAAGSGTWSAQNGKTWTSGDIPAGASVTIVEDTPAGIANATWGTNTISSAGKVTVVKGQTTQVTVTNPIALNRGGFSITKTVDGTGAGLVAADTNYTGTFSYPAGAGYTAGHGEWSVQNGKTWQSGNSIPTGAVVSLQENTPAPITNATWGSPTFSPSTVTIGGNDPVAVALTNTLTLNTGSFSVVKVVAGTGSALVPSGSKFTVDYSYPAGEGFSAGSGQLTVSPDGAAVDSPKLPVGAHVSLSEDQKPTVAGMSWGAVKFSDADFTVVASDQPFAVTLTNTANADPVNSASPTPSAQPGAQGTTPLASTGATMWGIGAGAGILALGIAAMVFARKRNAKH